jgi:hypothetical protein
MNRTYLLFLAGIACSAALLAQQLAQQTQSLEAVAGGRGWRGINIMPPLRAETGKPFSATVTSQTVQTLMDGTRVSTTTTTMQYRDAEGRVRTEMTQSGGPSGEPVKIITIRDPVAGVTYRLDPAKRTADKIMMAGARGRPMGVGGEAAVAGAGARGGRGGGALLPTPTRAPEVWNQYLTSYYEVAAAAKSANDRIEDLGTMSINGVPAHGTRITNVVPVGAIGNDREFRSVSERWFSDELNLLIKSVNTDPRFGTTTYELTNISRQPPDPSLFQPPADYTVR